MEVACPISLMVFKGDTAHSHNRCGCRAMTAAVCAPIMAAEDVPQPLVTIAEGILEVLGRVLLPRPAALPPLLPAGDPDAAARFFDAWLSAALTRWKLTYLLQLCDLTTDVCLGPTPLGRIVMSGMCLLAGEATTTGAAFSTVGMPLDHIAKLRACTFVSLRRPDLIPDRACLSSNAALCLPLPDSVFW